MNAQIWIGWDPNEMMASNVAQHSIYACAKERPDVQRLALLELRAKHIYVRPTSHDESGRLWDDYSAAPMSTEHAISRFFVPYLQEYEGWALFVDGDVLFRRDPADLFALADPRYAVQVVQHPPLPVQETKKDGAVQMSYPRKNWSSVMLFNCEHPAHRDLTLSDLNLLPGRDLHRFCWLADDEIGALPEGWNHLVNVSPLPVDQSPQNIPLVHFTLGTPDVPRYANVPFADEWRRMASFAGYRAFTQRVR